MAPRVSLTPCARLDLPVRLKGLHVSDRTRLADTRVRPTVRPPIADNEGRPVLDWRLVDDLQELGADLAASGASDTAALVRMAVLMAFHEASRSGPA